MASRSMLDKDLATLNRICRRIEEILSYCRGKRFSDFLEDTMLAEACAFNLLQIGEAAGRNLSDGFKSQHPEIPWRSISGLRNRIVHGYDDVQMTII